MVISCVYIGFCKELRCMVEMATDSKVLTGSFSFLRQLASLAYWYNVASGVQAIHRHFAILQFNKNFQTRWPDTAFCSHKNLLSDFAVAI